MSNSTLTSQDPLQNQVALLGSGIAGLFLQGLETGLVITQFCRWFSSERKDSTAFSTLVIFVTMVGFAQSGLFFVSTWHMYVRDFGQPILGPGWDDYTQTIPTLAVVVPVQSLMIRRCYHVVGKNMYIITPLVLLLIISIVTSIWSIVEVLRFEFTAGTESYLRLPAVRGISYAFLLNLMVPSILNVLLAGILLHCLIRAMKQVYAAHIRRRLFRLMAIAWQSAIPPTLCTIFQCILYIRYATARQTKLVFWSTVIQGMIGKLYVLSLFYVINDSGPTGEQPQIFVSTLTIPLVTEADDAFTQGTRIDSAVSRHRCPADGVPAVSVNTAV